MAARRSGPAQDVVIPVVEQETDNDPINPDHYNGRACADAIRSMLGRDGYIAWLRGTILKYNWRLLGKGKSHQDQQKALWYGHELEDVLLETDFND